MLQTRQVEFRYSSSVRFHFPDIQCGTGEALLVTGPSGVGKTTFLHLLGGILKPTTGAINVFGNKLPDMTERARDQFRGQNIGIVFQRSYFVASLSVLENLTLASWLAKGEKQVERAEKLLESLGLSDQKFKNTAQLSIGQQQRAAIARAMMNEPKLLLADEPTSSLDDEHCFLVAKMLQEQAQTAGAALIIVTHDQRLKNLFPNIQRLS